MSVKNIQVEAQYHAQRIDNFLISHLKGVPKSRIYRAIRKGEVRINKKRVNASYKLQTDDCVRIPPLRVAERDKVVVNSGLMKRIEKAILFEDESCLILNKPAHLAVHRGTDVEVSVIDALRARAPDQYFELVHRLDKETSGCLLIAKKREVLIQLQAQWQSNAVQKTYFALLAGAWQGQCEIVDAPLKKNILSQGERVVGVAADGKPATTQFKTLRRFKTATYVEATPITGRMHQIRVHAQYIGHPIVGDSKYTKSKEMALAKALGAKRLFLHAAKLTFSLPNQPQPITIEAPLDQTLEIVLDQLEQHG